LCWPYDVFIPLTERAVANDDNYIAYLQELFEPLGNISTKKMFGGFGIYCNNLMIALVIEDVLYLKTDDSTRASFSNAGGQAFIYQGKGKLVTVSYWTVPEEALESSEQMFPWAKLAYAAALRKEKTSSIKKSAKKKPSANL
jgi:DNA transformation protein and related proteins